MAHVGLTATCSANFDWQGGGLWPQSFFSVTETDIYLTWPWECTW